MFRTRWSIPDPAGPQIPPQGPQIHLRVPKFPLRARPQPHTSSRSSFGEDSDGFGFAPRGRRRHPEKSRWGCCRKGRGETPKSPKILSKFPEMSPKSPSAGKGDQGDVPCPCVVPVLSPECHLLKGQNPGVNSLSSSRRDLPGNSVFLGFLFSRDFCPRNTPRFWLCCSLSRASPTDPGAASQNSGVLG